MSNEVRLIDANALKYTVMDSFTKSTSMINIVGQIERAPTIEVEPVRHGKWIDKDSIFECSECHYSFDHEGYKHFFNFCPCCGAKMDLKED